MSTDRPPTIAASEAPTYGQLTSDMTDNIGGFGSPHNGLGVAILGTIIWCLILVVPGWLRFLRGDLK